MMATWWNMSGVDGKPGRWARNHPDTWATLDPVIRMSTGRPGMLGCGLIPKRPAWAWMLPDVPWRDRRLDPGLEYLAWGAVQYHPLCLVAIP